MKDHDVNWAQAIVSTIKEKAHRLVIERMKNISFYMGQSWTEGKQYCKIDNKIVGDVVCKGSMVPMWTKD